MAAVEVLRLHLGAGEVEEVVVDRCPVEAEAEEEELLLRPEAAAAVVAAEPP